MINPLQSTFQFLSQYLMECIPAFARHFLVMVFALSLLALLIRIIRR